jgi:hypothetical protein
VDRREKLTPEEQEKLDSANERANQVLEVPAEACGYDPNDPGSMAAFIEFWLNRCS